MAHTNVQLVSGNLTTGGNDPTFFIDNVNNKIGIGGVPDMSGDDSSNVLQVNGSVLATVYHGGGEFLTGIERSQWLHNISDPTKIYYNGGNVGIGVTDPDSKLEVRGNIRASLTDTNHGMFIDAGGTVRRDYGGNGAGLHFTANQIFPTNYLGSHSVGGIDLGSSSYRWNNVYTGALDASGTVTASSFSGIQASDVPTLNQDTTGSAGSCTGNSATATTAESCTGNSATATTATTAGSCTGNSATATTATTAGSCTGNSATATTAGTVTGKSSINKTAHSSGANDYHLELYSGNTNNSSNEVSLRFHQGAQYWGQIRFRSSQFYFTSGSDNALYTINTGRLNSESIYNSGSLESDGRIYADNGCHVRGDWLRVDGQGGIYFETYAGGWHMTDTTYVRCYNNRIIYTGGSILAGGNVTAYSDIRRKKDLLKIDNALDKVEELTGYTYTSKLDNKRYTGLIAQDVQKVLPEAVNTETDGHLSLAYGNMVGLLVEAVKELTRKNEILEARLNVIENNK